MSVRSALEELRRLSTITEECTAQALAARRRAQSFAHHYRVTADLFRKRAAQSRFPEIRERLLRIAASNERLSTIAELASDLTQQPPEGKSRAKLHIEQLHNRDRPLPDRLALSAATNLTTAAISKTRQAIERSLGRLEPRSYLEFEIPPGPPSPPRVLPEVHTRSKLGTIAGEPRKGAVRNIPAEDPVAQARRHVREAEAHVARQEALVEQLSQNDKLAALAEQARGVLDTLRQTRDLARQHLALELGK